MIKGLFDGKRWAALWKAVPDYYVPGFIMTLKISAAGLMTALILGVIFGTFSTMKFKPAKILSRIYVEFIQNTPLALQVLFCITFTFFQLRFPYSKIRSWRDRRRRLSRSLHIRSNTYRY